MRPTARAVGNDWRLSGDARRRGHDDAGRDEEARKNKSAHSQCCLVHVDPLASEEGKHSLAEKRDDGRTAKNFYALMNLSSRDAKCAVSI